MGGTDMSGWRSLGSHVIQVPSFLKAGRNIWTGK